MKDPCFRQYVVASKLKPAWSLFRRADIQRYRFIQIKVEKFEFQWLLRTDVIESDVLRDNNFLLQTPY